MGKRPTAAVVLLGCPKNRVDSETLLASLGQAGYAITSELGAADVIIIMTCAFLRSAVSESEAAIRRALAYRHRNPALKVVVAGCLVQRLGRLLLRRFPQVELIAGIDYLTAIPRLLRLKAGYASSASPTGTTSTPRLLSTPRHYAYVKIADGCDNHCSYCLIPTIRGSFRSRSLSEVATEAGLLAGSGVRELVVVAQDTTAYGHDNRRRATLPRLLHRLGAVPGIDWVRLMYAHPAHCSDALVREFVANRRLCRYIDMPVQHAADAVLARMNRGYRRADVERLIDRLRAVTGMRIRTTVIVGFPGETSSDFAELLDFIRSIEFDRLGAYAFSYERGTPAAALRPLVPKAVKLERLQAVMELQAKISRRRLRALRGHVLRVLADGPNVARTEWDAPEIDGAVHLVSGTATPGEFVSVEIVDSGEHDLVGRITGRQAAGSPVDISCLANRMQ